MEDLSVTKIRPQNVSVDFAGDGEMIKYRRTRVGRHVGWLGALCNDAVSDVWISKFPAEILQTVLLNAKQPEGLSSNTGNKLRNLGLSHRC
jgi:hypothetical protein